MNEKQIARLVKVLQYCLERCERCGGAGKPAGREWYIAASQIWLVLPLNYRVENAF